MFKTLMKKVSSWFVEILWLIVCLVTFTHLSFRGELIEILFLAVCAVFISILIISIINEIKNDAELINKRNIIIIFLCSYILLTLWLSLMKVIPEYNKIIAFERERSELIDAVMQHNTSLTPRLKLAKLYLYASSPIYKIESNLKGKGIRWMKKILLEKINKNEAAKFRDEIFELAEILFAYKNVAPSKIWYKNAFDAGRLDALKRYNERINERFKYDELSDPGISPFKE